jgi:hypothetical protein
VSHEEETLAELNDMLKFQQDVTAKMFRKLDKGKLIDGQDAQDAISEFAYGVSTEIHLIITLAGGGPNAWLDAEISKDETGWGINNLRYYATWTGAKIERGIREGDGLYRLAENYVETFTLDV